MSILSILTFLAVVVAALLGLGATKPDRISLQRSIEIQAPPERIFPFIDDLHNWEKWNSSTGAGHMEIIESDPPRSVTVNVDFRKPFVSHNINTFKLVPHANMTTVTWTWDGTNVIVMKVLSIFASTDRMMGSHFESGLQSLKRIAEADQYGNSSGLRPM